MMSKAFLEGRSETVDQRDVRIDCYSNGNGYVPPIRLTHMPTGTVLTSFNPNKRKAMANVRRRLEKTLNEMD